MTPGLPPLYAPPDTLPVASPSPASDLCPRHRVARCTSAHDTQQPLLSHATPLHLRRQSSRRRSRGTASTHTRHTPSPIAPSPPLSADPPLSSLGRLTTHSPSPAETSGRAPPLRRSPPPSRQRHCLDLPPPPRSVRLPLPLTVVDLALPHPGHPVASTPSLLKASLQAPSPCLLFAPPQHMNTSTAPVTVLARTVLPYFP